MVAREECLHGSSGAGGVAVTTVSPFSFDIQSDLPTPRAHCLMAGNVKQFLVLAISGVTLSPR